MATSHAVKPATIPPSAPVRAVTLGRQSKQREDDSEGSPRVQRDATAAFVAARGWAHVAHFEDVGASGYDPKAERPGLDAALAAIHAGEADVLVVWKLDRLTRQGVAEAVRIVSDLTDNGASLASVSEPFLDTSTAIGFGIFGLFAAMAAQESQAISLRTRATKDLLRQAGSFAGGQRHYGRVLTKEVRDKLTITVLDKEPAEAAIIADVASRVLDGASITSEAKRLNQQGIPTVSGAEWSPSTLSRTLKSPSLAGFLSTERGGIVRNDDGSPVEAWTPIVEPADWYRLQDVIASRAGGRRTDAVPTLLGGSDWFVCASCGGRMAGDRRAGDRGTYRCARHRRGSTACEHGAAVAMRHADDYLTGLVWERAHQLDPSDPADLRILEAVAARYAEREANPEADAARRAAQAVIADVEAALVQLDDDRAAGVFSGSSGTERYRRQSVALQDRADAARASLEAIPGDSPADDLQALLDALAAIREAGSDYDSPESPWRAWTTAERRDFLALFLTRVELAKGNGRGGGDRTRWTGQDRLAITWVGDTPF